MTIGGLPCFPKTPRLSLRLVPHEVLTRMVKSLAHHAAKASWACGVIGILLLVLGRGAPVIVELAVPVLIIVGIICVIVAFVGIRKHGVKGILAPSLVGLLINGLLMSFFVFNFLVVGDGPHS